MISFNSRRLAAAVSLAPASRPLCKTERREERREERRKERREERREERRGGEGDRVKKGGEGVNA